MQSEDSTPESGPVGVLALQGGFAKHLQMLDRIKVPAREVRLPEEIGEVERLILPGGESTTVGLLMQELGLGERIREAAQAGMPIWGTCMGMIMMAREIVGRPHQYSLGLLDIAVSRNAFGAQVHSFEDEIALDGEEEPVVGVFIRAPVVSQAAESVQILGRYQGKVVAVRQGRLIGTSFHPELTEDPRMHQYFLRI